MIGRLALVLGIAAALAACTGSSGRGASQASAPRGHPTASRITSPTPIVPAGAIEDPAVLAGSSWRLVFEDDALGHHVAADYVPTVQFVKNTLQWHACNDGSFDVQIRRGRLVASSGGQTLVSCSTLQPRRDDPVTAGDAEQDLHAVVGTDSHAPAVWFIDSAGTLHLTDASGSVQLAYHRTPTKTEPAFP